MRKMLQSRVGKTILGGTTAGVIILSGLVWNGQVNLDNVRGTVQELVERIQGLDNDRATLKQIANELVDQYNDLLVRYNNVLGELEYLYNSKNRASDKYNIRIQYLEGEIAALEKERDNLRDRKEHYQGELSNANSEIASGNAEIQRLEAELKQANAAALRLEQEVNEMVAKVAGIQPGIDAGIFDRLPIETPGINLVQKAEKIRTRLINEIDGVGEEIAVTLRSVQVNQKRVEVTGSQLLARNDSSRDNAKMIGKEVLQGASVHLNNSDTIPGQGELVFYVNL